MININDLIGKRKYDALKSYDFENMSAEEMVYFRKTHKMSVAEAEKKIADYERYKNRGVDNEANRLYFEKISNYQEKPKPTLTKKELWFRFKNNFKEVTGNELIVSDSFLANAKPLFYYFTDNLQEFKKCSQITSKSEISLDKGLLIIGDYGNGKSTLMNVLESCFKYTSKYFKGYSANDITLKYEGAESQQEKKYVIDRYSKGTLYFDDIKSERQASNYGKIYIFREILENRYNNKAKTYITCNYKKGYEGNVDMALQEFGEIYGERVYDRIFEMFNIIQFKGKSLRK